MLPIPLPTFHSCSDAEHAYSIMSATMIICRCCLSILHISSAYHPTDFTGVPIIIVSTPSIVVVFSAMAIAFIILSHLITIGSLSDLHIMIMPSTSHAWKCVKMQYGAIPPYRFITKRESSSHAQTDRSPYSLPDSTVQCGSISFPHYRRSIPRSTEPTLFRGRFAEALPPYDQGPRSRNLIGYGGVDNRTCCRPRYPQWMAGADRGARLDRPVFSRIHGRVDAHRRWRDACDITIPGRRMEISADGAVATMPWRIGGRMIGSGSD